MEFMEFATCLECGWHNPLHYAEEIEVAYFAELLRMPSQHPDWAVERACPNCGSTDLDVTVEEV